MYKKRIVDNIIETKLKGKGAVLIEGPKWCGKTTTSSRFAKSTIVMTDPKSEKENLLLAEVNPELLLEGNTPRLIDEWQVAPKLWDAIRFVVDKRNDEGQFLLTGSSTPVNRDDIDHSGAGRFAWVTMRTMSLYESGDSTGEVSLSDVFKGKNINGTNKLTLNDITYLICRGGWPKSVTMEPEIALEQPFDYIDAIVKTDASKVDGIVKNEERLRKFLRAYSRNVSTQVTLTSLKEDMIVNDVDSLNEDTISLYINAFKKMFVIEEMEAWNPNLRSKTAIRTSDTRYFVDPSIASSSLGLGPSDLIKNLNTCGLFFENLVVRDLRVYAESLKGNVYHYRDASNLECDAVIHLRNGEYGLVEIKLGGDKLIEEGVKNLLDLANKIDTDKMNKPSFLMIITATSNYAYRRPDGVYVVPIGCLKD
jgi:hypothetical protein